MITNNHNLECCEIEYSRRQKHGESAVNGVSGAMAIEVFPPKVLLLIVPSSDGLRLWDASGYCLGQQASSSFPSHALAARLSETSCRPETAGSCEVHLP